MENKNLEKIRKDFLSQIKASREGLPDIEKQIEKLDAERDVLRNTEACLDQAIATGNERLIACGKLARFTKMCEEKNWDFSDGYDRLLDFLIIDASKIPYGTTWGASWNAVFQSYQEDIEMKYAFN